MFLERRSKKYEHSKLNILFQTVPNQYKLENQQQQQQHQLRSAVGIQALEFQLHALPSFLLRRRT